MEDFIVLTLGHAQTHHLWQCEDISSPFLRLFYVKSGRAVIHLPDGDVEVTPDHLYLFSAYDPHAYECEPGFDFYYLFIFQRKQEQLGFFDRYEFPREVKANQAARLLLENYCHLYPQLHLPSRTAEAFLNLQAYREYAQAFMKMQPYERMQLHGLVEILLSYFVKHARERFQSHDDRLALLLDYVQQHLGQPISVDELADRACLTKSYLIRRFREAMGVTPIQYVLTKKVQRAQTLLLESQLNVSQIAAEVGFSDPAYFIRLFKRHIGFTPQEYRQCLIG